MADAKFVHLHVHSHYSLLDGLSKIDALVTKAKKYEMPALALTDHGNLYGAIEFYKTAKNAGIKPIIGLEAYVAVRSRHQKEAQIDSRRYHLTLLAKNFTGYQNLLKLVTASHLEGFYYKPRLDKDLLRECHQGLICLSGCLASELSRQLLAGNRAQALAVAREYQEIFGAENYYIEIMHHPKVERQNELRAAQIALAQELHIPLVATQDVHYLEPEDNQAHDTLIGIQNTQVNRDERRFSNIGEDWSFVSPKYIQEVFADIPEAVANTVKIADQCNLELTLGKFVFPRFVIPAGTTYDSELKRLAEAGLKRLGLDNHKEAKERLARELAIIKMKGYASYFLVVEDLIRFARERGIYYNIRGSVAGSLVTYALNVTLVNPLHYKIPFERFLNPDRPSAPDIDMDFADNRREEVIDYVREKYGSDKVAQVGTFGTMQARGSIRDVTRALGQPYSLGDKIAKLIPLGSQGFPMTIERALEISPELRELYANDMSVKKIIDLAKKIEGCARHISVHAAGVVIAPEPLVNYTPLQFDPKGKGVITQYDMYTIGEEGVGLTKFDFLGIRNLAILDRAVTIVKKTTGQEIDLSKIPLDDKKTFRLLSAGETEGLFQLNGAGMTRWLKELKPTQIEDINAMLALYRPGPMQFIPDYIARKHNPKLIKYPDPAIEKILAPTYGVLVYQDDLLMMAHDLAGYSWGEVDKFRKAVGKKIPKEMAAQKEKFIKGCMKTMGWTEKRATEIWTWIEPFSAYGFNKAHSVSYGLIAYQTAYMKANYPAEYMTACLTAEAGDTDQIALYIAECKRLQIPVLPPDLNESLEDFSVIKGHPDRIRFGLYSIKNIGRDIVEAIVAERKNHGPYLTLVDFLERVAHKNLNKKSLESLIKAGALDSLGEERGKLLGNIDLLLAHNKETGRNAARPASLFAALADQSTVPTLKLKDCPPADLAKRLAWEKELLGLYLSGHPLDNFQDKLHHQTAIKKQKENRGGGPITVIGLLEEIKKIRTRTGNFMAFGRLADLTDSMEVVFFNQTYEAHKEKLAAGNCLVIRGRLSHRNGELSLVADDAQELA